MSQQMEKLDEIMSGIVRVDEGLRSMPLSVYKEGKVFLRQAEDELDLILDLLESLRLLLGQGVKKEVA